MNAYTFSDVLIEPKYSEITSRANVNIGTRVGIIDLTLPIISANMKTITGPNMAIEMATNGGLGILHRFNTIDEAVKDFNEVDKSFSVGVSIGVQDADKERFDKLYEVGARTFCIDVAHGHHILVKNMLTWIRSNIHTECISIIAGNVATSHGALDMIEWGANVVKVGIGPGSVCQTRQRTGVGVPQLYALEQIYHAFKTNVAANHAHIIADGGIVTVGDIAKALKYADAVMIGSMIAGTSETPGKVFRDASGQFYKVYGGSASAENKGDNKFVEGMMKTIPFKAKVKYILREISDGLKSSFSYVGANNIKEFKENCSFLFITDGASRESKF